MYDPTDRRPIASRDRRVWITLAHAVAKSGISANTVSVAGMVFGILCGVAFYLTTQTQYWRGLLIAAAALCQFRLLCNMIDGMVAIETGKASPLGELFNEIPDRVSDSFALIGFGFISGSSPMLGFLAALIAMFTAYVRAVGRGAGAPQAFHGPMAKPHRMFLLTIAALYLAFTPASWNPNLWNGHSTASLVLMIVILGCVVTVVRRLNAIASSLKTVQSLHAAAEHREAADGRPGHS